MELQDDEKDDEKEVEESQVKNLQIVKSTSSTSKDSFYYTKDDDGFVVTLKIRKK